MNAKNLTVRTGGIVDGVFHTHAISDGTKRIDIELEGESDAWDKRMADLLSDLHDAGMVRLTGYMRGNCFVPVYMPETVR